MYHWMYLMIKGSKALQKMNNATAGADCLEEAFHRTAYERMDISAPTAHQQENALWSGGPKGGWRVEVFSLTD
jgi:hypothetical protein